jgi:hypothetical protein
LLKSRNLLVRIGGLTVAQIDEDVLYALLTIDHYRHGTRSMEAVLQMCTPMDGRIEKASLPSQAQLNMHVDGHEFFIRLYRGRARPSIMSLVATELQPAEKTAEKKIETEADGELGPVAKRKRRRKLGVPESTTPAAEAADQQ